MEMENPYRAPEAPLVEAHAGAEQASRFFVISITKMVVLYVATLGLFNLYWMYKHWSIQKPYMPRKINPPLRSLFMIFYIHSLARRVHEALPEERRRAWRYGSDATWAVVLLILSNVADKLTSRIPELSHYSLPFLILGLVPLIPLTNIQRRANEASGDPLGRGNASLTRYNVPFLILGGLLWVLILIGSVAEFAGVA
ncbi:MULTISPECIES: hypothetical protein [unclassified Pseudomonas]|uniref:hypothetical protein n=1 Tax=unclassified Pseudomonas TaxID=196821 RepID=UPI00158668E9|nr:MULTISPECIES: hypothetical protein [unclassified Pseudomonas]